MAEKQCNLLKNGGGSRIKSATVTDINNNNVTIYKCDNIVQFTLIYTYNIPASAGLVALTLPIGYRPAENAFFTCTAWTVPSNQKPVAIQITTNGDVTLNGYIGSGSLPVYITMTFIAPEQ